MRRRGDCARAAQAREPAAGAELPRLDELAAAPATRRAALCRLARRLLAAPHRGTRADADAATRRSTPARWRRWSAAVAELAELGRSPIRPDRARSWSALLERLPVPAAGAGSATGRRGAAGRAARGPRPALPGRVRVRPAGGRVPAAGRVRAVPVRRAPPRAGGARPACGCAPARTRWRPSATCSTPRSRARPSACSSPTAAPTRRATWRCPRRSSPTSPSCWAPTGRRAARRRLLADVVWDAGAGAHRARARARAGGGRGAAPAASRPRPRARSAREALAPVRHSRILSAGALERYGDCPVRWLVERELQPEPLEPEPEPLARGNLIHDVLERLLRRARRAGHPGRRCRGALEILDRLLAELAADGGAALGAGEPPVVRAGALRAIEADLRRYLEHEAATSADGGRWALELRFGFEGEEGSLPALELGEGAGAGAGPRRDRPRRRRPRRPRAWCATTRAAPGARHGRRRAGPRTASCRSRCTCSSCASSRGSSRSPASTSRCAATICAPAACSSRATPVGAGVRRDRRARAARSSTRARRRRRARGGAGGAAARRRPRAVPADLLARRLRYPAICRSQ